MCWWRCQCAGFGASDGVGVSDGVVAGGCVAVGVGVSDGVVAGGCAAVGVGVSNVVVGYGSPWLDDGSDEPIAAAALFMFPDCFLHISVWLSLGEVEFKCDGT